MSLKVVSDKKKTSDFYFKISYKEWNKLPSSTTPSYKRLNGNWTVFVKYFNSVQPACVGL